MSVYDDRFRFYSHCEGHEPTLLLIKTTSREVLQTFVSLFLFENVFCIFNLFVWD